MTAEEIAELFREMEDKLFASMARNMGAHEAWEEEEGFEWVQWQAEQIKGLRAFREEIQGLVNATYDKAKPAMEQMLTDAYHYAGERAAFDLKRSTGRAIEQQFFGVSPKMRGVIDNVLNDVERTRYAAINRMNSGYTSMLQRADIYAQSGTMTIPQAVDMASKDFVAAGLNCVEYSNGNRVGIDSYVEMALRTSSRDAAAQAEGEKRDEWEEWLVISNVINTTCPKCMKWQGKILIDDVYAHGKPDGEHVRLSIAKANGFLHPNCRHKPRTYIPDVTKIPDQPEKAKTKEQYNAEQKQRYYERNIRKYKRLRETALDADNKVKYDSKVKEWSKALDEHIEANPSLRKNPWRSSLRGTSTRIKSAIETPITEDVIAPIVENPRLIVPEFIEAKTIEEAQVFASQYVEAQFMDRTFKGVVDFRGISVDNANEINKALQTVFENFPETEKLSGIKVVSPSSKIGQKAFKDGADALFSYDPIQHGIYINKELLKNKGTFEAYIKKSDDAWQIVMNNLDKLSDSQKELALKYQNAGRSTVGETIQDMFTHELGHHVSWTSMDAQTMNALSKNSSIYAGRISGYANASNTEYLAESFTAYMRGERDILDPEFVKFVDSKLSTANGIENIVRESANIDIERLKVLDISNECRVNLANSTANTDRLKFFSKNNEVYVVDGVNVKFNTTEHETEIGELLSKIKNSKVSFVPEISGAFSGVSTPDYLVADYYKWDLKDIGGAGKDCFRDAIKRKFEQANHFILDISKSSMSVNTAIEQAQTVMNSSNTSFVDELIVIKNGEIVVALKRI